MLNMLINTHNIKHFRKYTDVQTSNWCTKGRMFIFLVLLGRVSFIIWICLSWKIFYKVNTKVIVSPRVPCPTHLNVFNSRGDHWAKCSPADQCENIWKVFVSWHHSLTSQVELVFFGISVQTHHNNAWRWFWIEYKPGDGRICYIYNGLILIKNSYETKLPMDFFKLFLIADIYGHTSLIRLCAV